MGAIGLLVAVAPVPAHAYFQDLFDWSKYTVRLGVLSLYHPVYEGSKNYKMSFLPSVDIRWKKVAFLSFDSLRIDLVQKPWLNAGPILSYNFGRSENASPVLRGMGNIGGGLAMGGYVDTLVGPFGLSLVVEREIAGKYGGVSGHFDVAYRLYKSDDLSVAVGTRMSFAGHDYLQTFFGVTEAQSVASGLPVYTPGSGIQNIGIGLVSNYLINDHWSLGSLFGYARVMGDAAKSPLVRDHGSANQVIGYLRLSYQF